MKRLTLILSFLFIYFSAFTQITLEGLVLLEDTNEPGIAVSILEEGTSNGTITEYDGTYKLEVKTLPVNLIFSYTGYISQTLTIEDKSPQEVILKMGDITICEIPMATDSRLLYTANYSKLNLEDLKIDNSVSLVSGMNTVPGIHIHSGALNTNRITIRGIGNRSQFSTAKIRAYLDEIPLTSGVGETTIEDIDMDMLDNIQIIKGPNVSNYGSGLGGSIIMQTQKIKRDFASTNFELGSYGLYRNSNSINIGTDRFTTRANYSFTGQEGYRENSEYKRHNFSLLNQFDYAENSQFNFLVNYIDLKSFIPSSLNEDDYLNEPTKAAFTWNKVKGFEDYTKLNVGASHNYGWNNWVNTTSIFGTFYDAYESRPFNILSENSRVLGARTKFNYNFETFQSVSFLKFGAEYFNEKYNWQTFRTYDGELGEHLSDNEERRSYYNIFAETDLEFVSNLTIELGINVNSTRYELEDFYTLDSIDISGNYKFNAIVSPRMGINYYWDEKGVSFYTQVSHGFNSPSLEETLNPDGTKNPDIQPEKGWNYEVGSRGDVLDRKLKYNASVYYMDVKDLLVAKRIALDQFQGTNAGSTSHFGIELDLKYDYSFGNQNLISPFINYHFANYKFNEFIDGDNDYSGNELTGAIPHKINAGIQVSSKMGLYGNILYQFIDQMPMRDDNSIYSDSYQLMNLKLGYKNVLAQNKLELDIYTGIRNIWDEKYASQILINAGSFGGNAPRYYYPGLPRNFYAGIQLKYYW